MYNKIVIDKIRAVSLANTIRNAIILRRELETLLLWEKRKEAKSNVIKKIVFFSSRFVHDKVIFSQMKRVDFIWTVKRLAIMIKVLMHQIDWASSK